MPRIKMQALPPPAPPPPAFVYAEQLGPNRWQVEAPDGSLVDFTAAELVATFRALAPCAELAADLEPPPAQPEAPPALEVDPVDA